MTAKASPRRQFISLLLGASCYAAGQSALAADLPFTRNKKKGQPIVGVASMQFAKAKTRRAYYYVVVFFGTDGVTHRLFSYLLRVDARRARLGELKRIEQQIQAELKRGVLVDQLSNRFESIITALGRSRAVRGVQLTDGHLQRLLGSPAMAQGKLGMLSDEADSAAERALTGMAVIGGGGSGIASLASVPMFADVVVTVGAAAEGYTAVGGLAALGPYGAVVAAGGCGVAVGLGINEVTGAIVQWWTDGDAKSAGEALATTALGRAIASVTTGVDPTTSAVGEGDEPATPPEGSAGTEGATAPASADESTTATSGGTTGAAPDGSSSTDGNTGSTDESTDQSTEESTEQPSDDATDDNCGQETCGSDDETGTTLPPDIDTGGSGTGNILLYALTGLAGHEARIQLRALDLAAGGLWGRERGQSLSYILALDQMLGGMYLRSIERGISTRRNQHGLRDKVASGGIIDVTKLRNFGLIDPSPIDVIFKGRTAATRNLR